MPPSEPSAVSRRPRLIFLTQWFEPEPVVKGLAFARRMTALGFDVEVVTGFPNYPGGKVYDGYRIRALQREVIDGVAVTRLALHPSHDGSRLGRILNYVTFFLSAALYLLVFARRAQVIYAYHPPLTSVMAAAAARILRRTPLVVDVQDMWPDTLRATGMVNSEAALGVIGILCRRIWRCADHLIVLSPGFRTMLIDRGVPDKKITVIPNWGDETSPPEPSAPKPAAFAEHGRFRVLFAGNMGAAQALDTILDAAALLARTDPHVEVVFLGSGIDLERLRVRADAEGLHNVRFLPRVPKIEARAWMTAADALIVHLRAEPLFAITIPSKTQDYMAAGRPIIMAVAGDAADLVRRSGGGLVVPPQNAQAMARAIAELAATPATERSAMGERGQRYYWDHLSFERGTGAIATLLHAVRGGEQ